MISPRQVQCRLLIEIASQFGIPVADVYRGLSGPNGDEDPGDKGCIHTDEFHNNDAGVLRTAELLWELGCAPLD